MENKLEVLTALEKIEVYIKGEGIHYICTIIDDFVNTSIGTLIKEMLNELLSSKGEGVLLFHKRKKISLNNEFEKQTRLVFLNTLIELIKYYPRGVISNSVLKKAISDAYTETEIELPYIYKKLEL